MNEPDSLPSPPPEPVVEPPALDMDRAREIEEQVVAALRTCFDPEIPVNIYELGLIYGIDVTPGMVVNVRMTLTSPACPAAGSLPPEVQAKVKAIPGVADAKVQVVWDPPWDKYRMSEAARLELGIFD
jgi:FeS assembly SUF system protein